MHCLFVEKDKNVQSLAEIYFLGKFTFQKLKIDKVFANTPTNNKGNKILTLYLHNMFQP
jgi:hypothetical protein